MLTSLLIANRGEIACRIIRTARRLGMRSIAVYSDADEAALHVRMADASVHIGPSPAAESYLAADRIIAAALSTGAEAIHPGYGFLSENAAFAEAVIAAGLIWVGPNPASIRAMGLKDAAKTLMAQAGVPVTPGYLGADQSPERLQREADAIGYPVLIKAVAGGGGRGMRRVDQAAAFADALQSCQREAAASFGDARVLIEKYIQRPRHIEVQVFGDRHGNVVHLFERDCSLQRRHQKVIEEAPAPGMDNATRAALCATAVQAARAVDYVGAGTVEFIADASEGLRPDRIWFMEMNTRLQVEHPVTEAITGEDLVEWQLLVASGARLPKRQDELRIDGHAIEARLYAEDPGRGFLPSIGRLERFHVAADRARVDAGVTEGTEISPYYDAMIAKMIVWDGSRRAAAARLAEIALGVQVWPVKTNAAFLARALEHPDFVAGTIDTGFIERHAARLIPPSEPPPAVLRAAAWHLADAQAGSGAAGGIWRTAIGFRVNAPASSCTVRLSHDGHVYETVLGSQAPRDGLVVESRDGGALVWHNGQSFVLRFSQASGAAPGGGVLDGTIVSPMPGRIAMLDVALDEPVRKGQRLLVMEAMKMELAMTAPFDGVVADLKIVVGSVVSDGVALIRIAPQAEGAA